MSECGDWSGDENEWLRTWPGNWNRYRGNRDNPTNTATISLAGGCFEWLVREPWAEGVAATFAEAVREVERVLASVHDYRALAVELATALREQSCSCPYDDCRRCAAKKEALARAAAILDEPVKP